MLRRWFPRRGSWFPAAWMWLQLSGCGVRSDPFQVPGVTAGGGGGGCSDVTVLDPLEDVVLEGTLPSRYGAVTGWCGEDAGAEDIYRLDMQNNRDLRIAVSSWDPNGFIPTIRVERGACGQDEPVTDDVTYASLCAAASEYDEDSPARYVSLVAGNTYYITVDAPDAQGGDYRVHLTYTRPQPEECPLHSQRPIMTLGDYFKWERTLQAGQGRVDGLCGGPGTEDVYEVTALDPGMLRARVTPHGQNAAIVDIRTGCALVTTKDCQLGAPGTPVSVTTEVPQALDRFYVVVDHHDVDPFPYTVEIWLE